MCKLDDVAVVIAVFLFDDALQGNAAEVVCRGINLYSYRCDVFCQYGDCGIGNPVTPRLGYFPYFGYYVTSIHLYDVDGGLLK